MTANYEQLPPSSTSARPEQDHLVPHAAHEMESELSLGELTARLSQQVSRMVREELALAQIQGKQRAKRAGVGAGLCGASVSIVRLAGLICGIPADDSETEIAVSRWSASARLTGRLGPRSAVALRSVLHLGGPASRRPGPGQPFWR